MATIIPKNCWEGRQVALGSGGGRGEGEFPAFPVQWHHLEGSGIGTGWEHRPTPISCTPEHSWMSPSHPASQSIPLEYSPPLGIRSFPWETMMSPAPNFQGKADPDEARHPPGGTGPHPDPVSPFPTFLMASMCSRSRRRSRTQRRRRWVWNIFSAGTQALGLRSGGIVIPYSQPWEEGNTWWRREKSSPPPPWLPPGISNSEGVAESRQNFLAGFLSLWHSPSLWNAQGWIRGVQIPPWGLFPASLRPFHPPGPSWSSPARCFPFLFHQDLPRLSQHSLWEFPSHSSRQSQGKWILQDLTLSPDPGPTAWECSHP